MSQTTDKQVFDLIEHTLFIGHEHIIAIFRNHDAVIEYLQKFQKPALENLGSLLNTHLSHVAPEMKKEYLKLASCVASYHALVTVILNDHDKKGMLNRCLEHMNAQYEDIKDTISEIRAIELRKKAVAA